MQSSVVPSLAFTILDEIKRKYSEKQQIPNEALLDLHSLFGEVLVTATELLEACSIVRYETDNGNRCIFKVGTQSERYTVYHNINFCQCPYFRNEVLEKGSSLICKHVLALKLNEITRTRSVKVEKVTGSQFVEFLNEQLNNIEEDG